MTLVITHTFFTRDGHWYEEPGVPFTITQPDMQKYGAEIEAKGAGTHLFVRAWPGALVHFFIKDGNGNIEHEAKYTCDKHGWCNHAIAGSSAFWGIDNGPWGFSVDGEVVKTRGLGLPEGYHVSTFTVVAHKEQLPSYVPPAPVTEPPLPTPDQEWDEIVSRRMRGGIQVWERVLQRFPVR